MKRGIIIVFILSIFAFNCEAKDKIERDTVQVALFNGFSVHTDLISGYKWVKNKEEHWDVGLRVNLKDRYFPAFEMGYNEAMYYRLGCDYNLLKNKHDDYKLFLGARYAFAPSAPADSEEIKKGWAELVFGLDAKICGPIHLGWDLRYTTCSGFNLLYNFIISF